jgi:nitrogen permease regulator 3-like protein
MVRKTSSQQVFLTLVDPSSRNVLRTSSLAKAIATLYSSISTSRIAHIDLTTHLSFSLQIPIATSISHLPAPTSPQLPGVWLTTATSIPSHDEINTTRTKLASHFALLLLSDLHTILADISSSSPLAEPLTHYLRCTTPTKSFFQISQTSGIPLDDVYFLASHLIYWRRARAIPPLHQRDIYIVSPNADMRKLRSASTQYSKLFPALPTLPKILSLLSSATRPYRTIIPNKDHKSAYMDILAWLMRGGRVTQLRTFAWVRVPEHIQADVADVVAEEERKAEKEKNSEPDPNGDTRTITDETDTGHTDHLAPMMSSIHSTLSSTSSQSSARTAIPLGVRFAEAVAKVGRDAAVSIFRPRLILYPNKASGLESRYLDSIAEEIERAEGRDSREAWNKCLSFFDGEHPLEHIAVREGWKKKKVEGLRAAWVRMGFLSEVRHW